MRDIFFIIYKLFSRVHKFFSMAVKISRMTHFEIFLRKTNFCGFDKESTKSVKESSVGESLYV